jgi:hypothetical protein
MIIITKKNWRKKFEQTSPSNSSLDYFINDEFFVIQNGLHSELLF